MSSRGDELLDRVFNTGDDKTSNDLLDEFWSGYPVNNLRRLLTSQNERAIKAGVWIASELGDRISNIMSDIEPLLKHPLRYVRFFAIDAVLGGATSDHGELVAKIIPLLHDLDDSVRWKAMWFLAKATRQQMESAIPHIDPNEAELLQWLLLISDAPNRMQEVTAKLQGTSMERRFAAAAAARLKDRNPALLRQAARSADSEVSSFAKDEISTISASDTHIGNA